MRIIATLVCAGSLQLACASGPTVRTVHLHGAEQLNPNRAQESTPVNVRIYHLVDRVSFEEATFDALWDDGRAVLDTNLVGAAKEEVVTTGGSLDVSMVIPDGVRFIGIAALFNQEEGPWRAVVAVDEVDDSRFVLEEFGIHRIER